MAKGDLDFSNYQGPVKNPFTATESSLAPRKVTRISVSREAVVTVQQVEVLAKVSQKNDEIGPALVEMVEDQFPPRESFRRIPGIYQPESIHDGHLAEVVAAAMRILHQKT